MEKELSAGEVVHDTKAEAQGEERVLRRTLRPLREVWMTIGMEKWIHMRGSL